MTIDRLEMKNDLERMLAECIADMERGASVEHCLKAREGWSGELRPLLESWTGLGRIALAKPSTAAFDRGRQAMLTGLTAAQVLHRPSPLRLSPAFATVTAAVAAAVLLLGAAGTTSALGGPNPAGDMLSAIGVTTSGAQNNADRLANAHNGCVAEPSPAPEATSATDACEDANRGHGNDPDKSDPDNPGQGSGSAAQDGDDANSGHGNDPAKSDPDNPGQGQGGNRTDNDNPNAGRGNPNTGGGNPNFDGGNPNAGGGNPNAGGGNEAEKDKD
jgi:hypothetical protein